MPEQNEIDLKSICLNPKFGDLKFEKALINLSKMKADLEELKSLNFGDYLTQTEIQNINAARIQFDKFVNQINNFNLGISSPQQERDRIEGEIDRYYQLTFINNTRSGLMYLRQQIKLDSKTEKELQQAVANAKKIEKELQDRLDQIKKDEVSVEQGKGIVSSKYLSKEYNDQYVASNNEADDLWFKWAKFFYGTLAVTIILSFIAYLILRYNNFDKILLIEVGVFSLLIISLEFFVLKFSINNYNINKNIAAINKHRRNVAETLVNFLESNKTNDELNSVIIGDATKALFDHQSNGYLSTDQMQISTPVLEMVTKIIKDKI